jgi:hypothetical protein
LGFAAERRRGADGEAQDWLLSFLGRAANQVRESPSGVESRGGFRAADPPVTSGGDILPCGSGRNGGGYPDERRRLERDL